MERLEIVCGGKRLEAAWFDATHDVGRERAIVLLHEGLGCIAMWRDFPEELAQATGLPVFAYSRAGYGGSDPVTVPRPLEYMREEGLRVLPEVLSAAGIREAILVGHSDGGSIAIISAATEPRVRGIALFAAHVFCEDVSVQSIAKAKDAFVNGDLRARLEQYHGKNVDCAFWGWNEAWLDPAFMQWNIEEYLPRIGVCSLVMQGEDDPYGTSAQVAAITRGVRGPCTRVMLPGVGHAPHKEATAETLRAVAALARTVYPEA